MNEKIDGLLSGELIVVNVGPSIFGDTVRSQGIEVLQVDWQPTAAGDSEMIDILDLLGGI